MTRTLGRYEIRGEIGRGNMGVVYRAHDPVIDRPIALKTVVLPESISEAERDTFLKRFFQEARTAGKLNHPNVVVTHDAATDEATGTPFIAMELVDGETLSLRLEKEGHIAWRQAVDWVISVAQVAGGFKVLAQNQMGERMIASPVPVAGRLLLRGERHLFCVAAP